MNERDHQIEDVNNQEKNLNPGLKKRNPNNGLANILERIKFNFDAFQRDKYDNPDEYNRGLESVGRHEFCNEIAEIASTIVGDVSQKRALDLAAGTGAQSQALLDHGFGKVAARDLSPHFVDFIAENIEVDQEQIFDPKIANINNYFSKDTFNLENEKVDLITIVAAIRYVKDPVHFFNKIQESLNDQGTLVIPLFPLDLKIWALKQERLDIVTFGGLQKIVEASGLEVEFRDSNLDIPSIKKPKYLIAKKTQ